MGKERDCSASFDWIEAGRELAGRAFLELDEIRFRRADGARAVRVRLAEFRPVDARAGVLALVRTAPRVRAEFRLGADAAAWRERIENPLSVCSKLGAKPGVEVRVHGKLDAQLARELAACGALVKRRGHAELELVEARTLADLARLPALVDALAPGAHVWVIYPKGRKDVSESALRDVLRSTGARDTKTCRVSDELTALRWSKPRA